MSGTGRIRLLEAKRDLAQAELDAALAELGTLVFRRPNGQERVIGPVAVVISPGCGEVFLDGLVDESRILRDAAALARFCNEITADPRWCIPPSGRRAKPPG